MALLKPKKSLIGGLAAAGVLIMVLWVFVGGPLKIFGPHLFGYDHLGWRHVGVKTVKTISIRKWIGADTVWSFAAAPFRHHKVYLKKGDALIIEYDASIDAGGLILSVYRTNLSILLQGPLVDHHQSWRLDKGDHRGAFEYIAPRDGFYEFNNEVRWSYRQGNAIPLPDFDLEFEYHWRVRHG